MEIKTGADIKGLHANMRFVLAISEKIYTANGRTMVITSGLDGTHSAGSYHYSGRAVDLRTRYFDRNTAKRVADAISAEAGCLYKIILESNHIHISYIGF